MKNKMKTIEVLKRIIDALEKYPDIDEWEVEDYNEFMEKNPDIENVTIHIKYSTPIEKIPIVFKIGEPIDES